MSEHANFRINMKTGEIEISGSEQFVNSKIESLEEVLVLVSEFNTGVDEDDGALSVELSTQSEQSANRAASNGMEIPETFGEWMHSFRDDITDIEKALITARFVQAQSPDNDFKTAEVNKSLIDHGIKLSNPSNSLKKLEARKFLFQTRKVGKLSYKRVSTDGQAHLAKLKRES